MPFIDVVERAGAIEPVQIGFTGAKVGVILELTVTSNVVIVAHCPAEGVNV
jgi:hypothetical protein